MKRLTKEDIKRIEDKLRKIKIGKIKKLKQDLFVSYPFIGPVVKILAKPEK